MPTSVYDPEIASAYGALDFDAAVDGSAVTAHMLRSAARSMHRLLAKPEPVLSALYDTRATDFEGRASTGPALPWWTPVDAWPINLMPGRESIDVRVTLRVPSGVTLRLQLATRALPFDRAARSGRYKTAAATGSWETVEFDGVPVESVDELTLYVTGVLGSTLGSTGTYGTPNTGTVIEAAGDVMLTSGTSTSWVVTAGNTWALRHLVVFLTGTTLLTGPRLITAVENGNATIPSSLRFAPALAVGESARLSGSTYEIRSVPTYRLAAVTAWSTPRTTL